MQVWQEGSAGSCGLSQAMSIITQAILACLTISADVDEDPVFREGGSALRASILFIFRLNTLQQRIPVLIKSIG